MRTDILKTAVAVAVFSVFLGIGCNQNPVDESGAATPAKTQFTDSRDGKVYDKVTVGTQVWMAENLNYNAEGSRCYGEGGDVADSRDERGYPIFKQLSPDEVEANCAKYGRLYDWKTARSACPAGWHTADADEWQTLVNYAGGKSTAGKHLKSKSGWYRYDDLAQGNGTDKYGFSALPGGIYYEYENEDESGAYFDGMGCTGMWWTSDAEVDGNAFYWHIYCGGGGGYVYWSDASKENMYSVRCVEN